MNKRIILGALLVTAFFLMPGTSRARLYNVNTGRFQTMDTYQGENEDPLSLHKYLYGADNPINRTDPSGHDDIGEALAAIDISASLATLANITTLQGALSGGGTPGPDVTKALQLTLDDVDRKLIAGGKWKALLLSQRVFDPLEQGDWDIEPRFELGWGQYIIEGGTQGTGTGDRTVQYSYQSGSLKVYYAGAVNYVLWGHMFGLFHAMFPTYPEYSLSSATGLAYAYKRVGSWKFGYSQSQISSAMAFIKLGYEGTDPSNVALPLKFAPNNVAKPAILQPWQFYTLDSNNQ